MRKIFYLLFFLFTFNLLLKAAEPDNEWWGQSGTWTRDATTNALKCDATTNFGGENNWIATTFGTAGPWKDLTVKFDFYMPDHPTNSIVWAFGQASPNWASDGVKIIFNKSSVDVYNPNWTGGTIFNTGGGAKLKLNGWNTAVINISSAGVVTVKVNGINGSSSFTTADINTLSGDFCSVDYKYAAGYDYQMRNIEFTKGAVTKKYFTCTPTAYTNMNMFSSTNAWFPVSVPEAVGPDNSTGGWYTVTTPGSEKIKFDGTITPTLTGIRTEKADAADDWWGTTIKFKAEVDAAGGTTTYKVGSNGVWNTRANGGRCIMLNINKYEARILLEHQFGESGTDVQLWDNNSGTYAPYTSTGPFNFEVIISDAATHTITVKINGVAAPVTYNVTGLGLTRLNANGPMYFEVYPGASPFVFSNVEMKKAGVAKTFFPTLNYVIAATANNGALGSVTGAGTYQKSTDVTLTATATSGNRFINWTENGSAYFSTNPLSFSVVAGKTLVANFESNTVNLSTTTNTSALVNCAACDLTVANGAELTVNQATAVNSITVQPGAKLTINAGQTLTGAVVLESSPTGTATVKDSYSTSTLSATVKQYVELGRNWYISSPIATANYAALNKGAGVVEFNEVTGLWVPITNGTLTRGKGYIQVATAVQGTTGTVEFAGTTNSGNVSVTLSRTATKGNGFNLVGNPYPSYIDWTMASVANTNVLPTAWFRTKKTVGAGGGYGFATVNAAVPSSPEIVSNNANTTITKNIPPMQAYWVRLIENPLTTTYTVTNAMRAHVDNVDNRFKAPSATDRQRVRLQLSNGTETDEALIYFDEVASNSFDRYDSPKMLNESEVTPDLYSKAGSEKLVINGLNQVTDNLELPLGFGLGKAATGLTIKATELSNLAIGTKVYLLDKDESTQTELLPTTEYTFETTTATTNNESRFSLLFRTPSVTTGVGNDAKFNAQVFVNATNQIVINVPETCSYNIYNAVGQLIEGGFTTSQLQIANSKLQTGMYVVKLIANGNKLTTRVIVK